MRIAEIEIEYRNGKGELVTEKPKNVLKEKPVTGIVDNDGKKVTYQLSGGAIIWSKNVTPDIEEIGQAMLRSKTALQWLDRMDKAPHKIYLKLSMSISAGRDFAIAAQKPNKYDPLNKLDFVEIDIQKGKLLAYIAQYQADAKIGATYSNPTEQIILYDKLSAENDIEALIAANAGHEAVHATDTENIKQGLLNSFKRANNDIEAYPEQVETQILKECYAKYEI